MNRLQSIICIGVIALFSVSAAAQSDYRVMCYNVENLFDTRHDSLKLDDEYLPGNLRGWNYERHKRKIGQIAQVIAAIGRWEPPSIIGLCEIENRAVLDELTRYSPLKNLYYEVVHYESPDVRGVDVALIYRKERFEPLCSAPIRIRFADDTTRTTRDILYVMGRLPNRDTLHLYVAHLPSRLGGAVDSENRRVTVTATLRAHIDSLQQKIFAPKILIMGDFNDYPSDIALTKHLRAELLPSDTALFDDNRLYNLCYSLHEAGIGSYKHEGTWGMLDQIIVSGALLRSKEKTEVVPGSIEVFAPEWLLMPDEPLGKRPFRTYIGMRYVGGYSDHLPVSLLLDLK